MKGSYLNTFSYRAVPYEKQNELYHHGILGQKWGVRRYQNKDGSLTPAGKKNTMLTDHLKNYQVLVKNFKRK